MKRRYQGEKIPAPKNGSARLKQIVLKACEYYPKDRFWTAQEMYDELDKLQRNSESQGMEEEEAAGTVSIKNVYTNQQKENIRKDVYVQPSGRSKYDFDDGPTVGETMYGFSDGQTAGNSWGGGFETIGAYGRNTSAGTQNTYEEEEVSETIGIKNPRGKRMEPKVLDDLHVTVQITEKDLGSNKKVSVDYPDGRKKSFDVEIPENKLNGSIIRLKGEGNTSKGDLILHLEIQKKQVYVAEGAKDAGKKYQNHQSQTEKLDEEKEWKLAMVEEMAWTSVDKVKAGIVTAGVAGLALVMLPVLGVMAIPMWVILFAMWYFLAIKGREPEMVKGWINRSKQKIDFDEYIAKDTAFAKRLYYDKCPKKAFLKYIKKLNPEAAEEIKASK